MNIPSIINEHTTIFVHIMTLHWIGDFILQSRKMADNKSSSIKWLSIHVLTYTATLLIGMLFFTENFLEFALINGILHWVTDFFTSKESKIAYQSGDIHGFFMIIGFDQLIHNTCLYISYLILVMWG